MAVINIRESELKTIIKNVVSECITNEGKKSKKSKFDKVMKEFAAGTLHSGDGSIVKNQKQALAIAYSESGLDK